MKKIFILSIGILVTLLCASIGSKKQTKIITDTRFMLDTFITVTIYDTDDDKLIDDVMDICQQYEDIFSMHKSTSELYKINHRDAGDNIWNISDDLSIVISKGLEYSAISDGRFDITIGEVSSLWHFDGSDDSLPSQDDIDDALESVGYRYVKLDGNIITFLRDDTKIDLGAVAKGYIADKMKEYLISKGVQNAIINLGGNVLCIGDRIFTIGIQEPYADRSSIIGKIQVSDESVVTAGIYERYFIVDGKRYHHILNPKTGYPYNSDILAVTIVCEKSLDADILATTAFTMGVEDGSKLIESMEDIYGYFVMDDHEMIYTDNAQSLLSKE